MAVLPPIMADAHRSNRRSLSFWSVKSAIIVAPRPSSTDQHLTAGLWPRDRALVPTKRSPADPAEERGCRSRTSLNGIEDRVHLALDRLGRESIEKLNLVSNAN